MFDLEKAVNDWLHSRDGARCLRARKDGSLDEFKDHLLCEIERLQAQGLAPEAAFEQAKRALDPESLLSDEEREDRRTRFLVRATIFAWVAAIVAVALLYPGEHPPGDRSNFMLLMVLSNAAIFSIIAIRRARGKSKRCRR